MNIPLEVRSITDRNLGLETNHTINFEKYGSGLAGLDLSNYKSVLPTHSPHKSHKYTSNLKIVNFSLEQIASNSILSNKRGALPSDKEPLEINKNVNSDILQFESNENGEDKKIRIK